MAVLQLLIIMNYSRRIIGFLRVNRLVNCPGMAGVVPELNHGVPCPRRGSFCPGNVKIDHRAWIYGPYIHARWSIFTFPEQNETISLFTNECIVFCMVFVSPTLQNYKKIRKLQKSSQHATCLKVITFGNK